MIRSLLSTYWLKTHNKLLKYNDTYIYRYKIIRMMSYESLEDFK